MSDAPKTLPTDASVDDFVAAVEAPGRRADAQALLALMREITHDPGQMWGPSIVGFGRYHYVYASGREGDWPKIGFSPRKSNLVLYIMPGFAGYDELLQRLGKHKTGSSCLYLNKLADVDPAVLRELIAAAWEEMGRRYG
jgi:hypothetical protein